MPLPIKPNPTQAKKLLLALASGRPQPGSNGDGNASSANMEGTGEEAPGPMSPATNTQLQSSGGFATGTRLSGYSTPDEGPFRCDNCKFFDPQGSLCRGPNVMKDPQVQKSPDGRAIVNAAGCCSKDYTPNKSQTPGFKAVSRPGTLGGMAPGSTPAGQGSNGMLQAPRTGMNSPGSVG